MEEIKIKNNINWETIKTELQNKLNKVKSDKDMKEFCEDIFGGFLFANREEIKKSIMQSEMGTDEIKLKPHTSERAYLG